MSDPSGYTDAELDEILLYGGNFRSPYSDEEFHRRQTAALDRKLRQEKEANHRRAEILERVGRQERELLSRLAKHDGASDE